MPEGATQNAPGFDTMDTFAQMIAGMSRFLSQLSRSPAFTEGTVVLGEWCALAILAKGGNVTNSTLARLLGVTNRRAAQLCASLSKAELVVVAPAADSRRNAFSITPAGKTALKQLNAKLEKSLAAALGSNLKLLDGTERTIQRLMRMAGPAKAAKES